MKVMVTINGTAENPWHRLGLKANPFPQIAKVEAAGANAVLRSLDSDPIHNEAELRKRLQGCSSEFVNGCIERYTPGKRVSFAIEFPTPWDWEI